MNSIAPDSFKTVVSHLVDADKVALVLCSKGTRQLLALTVDPQCPPRLTGCAPFVVSESRLEWGLAMGLPKSEARVCQHAARNGNLAVLHRARDLDFAWDSRTTDAAAAGGHLDILKYCLFGGTSFFCCFFRKDIVAVAAAGGHVHVLEWLLVTAGNHLPRFNEKLVIARYGQQFPLAYSNLSQGCRLACTEAARGGHLDCLRWLREDCHRCIFPWRGEPTWERLTDSLAPASWGVRPGAAEAAAEGGHLHVLEWLDANVDFGPLPPGLMGIAAGGGHLNILDFLRFTKGLEWEEDVADEAACAGHLHVLQWLRSVEVHGSAALICWWGPYTLERAASGDAPVEVLRWLRENGCPWTSRVVWKAAGRARDRLDVLQFIQYSTRELGFFNHGSDSVSIQSNSAEIGPPLGGYPGPNGRSAVRHWSPLTCAVAASVGDEELLAWLYINECEWDERTCTAAAQFGHLQVLQFARWRHCPWDASVLWSAALGGHLEVLTTYYLLPTTYYLLLTTYCLLLTTCYLLLTTCCLLLAAYYCRRSLSTRRSTFPRARTSSRSSLPAGTRRGRCTSSRTR